MPTSSYDFVIIGGGTAGLVVATRLSEDPTQRILVLEAGKDHTEDPRVVTPLLYAAILGSEADWNFTTEPQPNLNGRTVTVNQGKALGGSSAINAQVFVPPTKDLVDSWEALGNHGWNWQALRDYFTKTYSFPPVNEASKKALMIDGWTAANDSAQGPLQLSFQGGLHHPFRQAWVETFKAKGYCMAQDPFLGASVGAFSCLGSIDPVTKHRSYAATAYYKPVQGRENLDVITDAHVEKIIFQQDSSPPKATGVQYKKSSGEIQTVMIRKEVIVAAGAFQSPKILELSGIGDAKILEKHGIQVVQNLPTVGENLHDHIFCGIGFETVDDLDTIDALVRKEPEATAKAMQEYATTKTGWLTTNAVDVGAYLPVVEYHSDQGQVALKNLLMENQPSLETDTTSTRARAYYEVLKKTLLDSKLPTGAFLPVTGQFPFPVEATSGSPSGPLPGKFITITTMLSQPLSRGSVHIVSRDPSVAPAINPNYLSNPIDLEVLAHHMLYIETIAASSPVSKLFKQPLRRMNTASQITDLEAAKRFVQASAVSIRHPAGSCAMLPEDNGGVVDTRLKVYGLDNVRVVDSSAIPLISTANLQATVYAFAERAADLIKEDYGLK